MGPPGTNRGMEGIAIDLDKATVAECMEEISRHKKRAIYVAANPSLGLSAEPGKVIELYEAVTRKLNDEVTFLRGEAPGGESLEETYKKMELAATDAAANKLALRDEEIARLSGQVRSARAEAKAERDDRKQLTEDLATAISKIRDLEDSNVKLGGELEVANATIDGLRAEVLRLMNQTAGSENSKPAEGADK